MSAERKPPDWIERFPALHGIGDDAAWLQAARAARSLALPAGRKVFTAHAPCREFFLLIDGSVRVQKISESGHAIVLYRLEPGQLCELTASSLLTGAPYAAEAVAETDVRLAVLSRTRFQRLMSESPRFRAFVFSALGKAVDELAALVEQIAFEPVDRRLARCLLVRTDPGGCVEATHKALAAELGTAREVVSRLLERFKRRGWVRLRRGRIEVLDPTALEQAAGGADSVT